MNTNYFWLAVCAVLATVDGVAFGQQASPTKSPSSVASSTSTSALPANAAVSGGKSPVPAKAAAASSTLANPAAFAHPAYAPGPDFPYEYEYGYGYDGSCADGCCYPAYGFWNSWIRCPRLSHWGSVEYLVWWRSGEFLPPLVSNGPLTAADATILFGNGTFDFGPQPGGRVTFGAWWDDLECFGLGARLWGLGDGEIDFQQTGAPGAALARPFFNPDGTGNAVNVAGNLGGSIDIQTRSEVYGGDVLFRKRIECGFEGRLDCVFGYQFSRIDESILIQTSTNLAPAPNTLDVFDQFDAQNQFHGGVIGLQAELDGGPFTLGLLTKIGLGSMEETVTINGGGNPANSGLQGLLAQNTNIGVHAQDVFAVVPEVNLNVGYRVTENFDLTFGYSMIYWSHVARPGNTIDLVVDTTPPVTDRPRFAFNATDFWVMGFNLGCQWSF